MMEPSRHEEEGVREPFTESSLTSDRSRFCHPSYCKTTKIPLYVTVIFLLVVVILAVIGLMLNGSPSSDSTSQVLSPTEKGNIQSQRQVQTIEQTDSKCVRYTPQYYLDQLSDNIDDMCGLIEKPHGGTYLGLTPCGIGSKKYIKNFCLCDSHINCVGTRYDDQKKTGCFNCLNKDHCPCQNGGTCKPCDDVEKVSCKCSNGTIGSYCTKITQRLCHVIKEETEGDCDTNNKTCFTKEYSQLLKCEWSNNISSFLNDHPRCSNEIVEHMGTKTKDPLKDALGSAGKQERSSNTSQTSSNNFYIGIIVISVLSLILLLLYIYKSRNKHNR